MKKSIICILSLGMFSSCVFAEKFCRGSSPAGRTQRCCPEAYPRCNGGSGAPSSQKCYSQDGKKSVNMGNCVGTYK